MLHLLSLATLDPSSGPNVIDAWDQFTEAISNYRAIGTLGLLALAIGVVVSVLKRFGSGGLEPNWWMRLPRLGRRAVVVSLGALAGVLAAIQGGANPGEAILLGFSGVLSILGHEVAQRYGLIGPFVSDPARNPEADPPPRE